MVTETSMHLAKYQTVCRWPYEPAKCADTFRSAVKKDAWKTNSIAILYFLLCGCFYHFALFSEAIKVAWSGNENKRAEKNVTKMKSEYANKKNVYILPLESVPLEISSKFEELLKWKTTTINNMVNGIATKISLRNRDFRLDK